MKDSHLKRDIALLRIGISGNIALYNGFLAVSSEI